MPCTVSTPILTVNGPNGVFSGGSNILTHTCSIPIPSLTMYEVCSKPMRNPEGYSIKLLLLYTYYSTVYNYASVRMRKRGIYGSVFVCVCVDCYRPVWQNTMQCLLTGEKVDDNYTVFVIHQFQFT